MSPGSLPRRQHTACTWLHAAKPRETRSHAHQAARPVGAAAAPASPKARAPARRTHAPRAPHTNRPPSAVLADRVPRVATTRPTRHRTAPRCSPPSRGARVTAEQRTAPVCVQTARRQQGLSRGGRVVATRRAGRTPCLAKSYHSGGEGQGRAAAGEDCGGGSDGGVGWVAVAGWATSAAVAGTADVR